MKTPPEIHNPTFCLATSLIKFHFSIKLITTSYLDITYHHLFERKRDNKPHLRTRHSVVQINYYAMPRARFIKTWLVTNL